ncbi:helix-turn-helix domain-containing protein [Mycobacteroides abscessus]|uniref:helix-turn-helix domain-containing protein n=1 Tax=Mycobacteroides abscessus TaxID=36809 RepID=UPI0009A654A0|nr:helix-turn-helix transcriptional regulator [Mycobacteroides abscessus]SKH88249.1 Antitoxin HigA [Mycobacteroides abscessus subsp. massiliense]SKH92145.1 Antitoxin HigA [Mycobacteroides abscessus subsp. massiliense]SKI12632.1 Antitoxin HigA [Mycobacteroides abscessus subsp. massiliense]SKK21385.1 Antitoxin HigA [Mycobacteroides abscessus subsp. massiliense]SKK31814.1 Antitoxin HigA [Mycobacteroides abscessus subsp. massiliense]
MSENGQPADGAAPENRRLPVPINDYLGQWFGSTINEYDLPTQAEMTQTLLRTIGSTGRAMSVHFVPDDVPTEVVNEVRARKVIRALKSAREDQNLTVAVVGERCGIDKSGISRFENDTSDPRLSTLLRYAGAVGVDLTIHINGKNVSDYIPLPWAPQKITADLLEGMPCNPFTLRSPHPDSYGDTSIEPQETNSEHS